ncbi:fibronectin type III domain-containing protein [Helicobacter muridarum]|uniref:Fibronectin type III domain-containing protein n=1 Tax=Helicobacter muridarum TaxID=216 RepID=A0A4U8TLJ7_9HELI|nr:fibronectin type III domain-containing protein [Helicobacter muridarum]TLE00876.1 fibronectin type III domain-containing protein [Helicobacter muridarum]
MSNSSKSSVINDEVDMSLPVVKSFNALPDSTSIGFEWKVPEGDLDSFIGYVIYRKDSNGNFQKIAFIKNALSTHYFDSKLQPQTDYEYAIALVGEDSRVSKKSEVLKVRTAYIDPVDFVYTSKNYAGRIKIFWSPSPNPVVKNYIIQRKDPKTDTFVNIGSTNNRMSVEFFDNGLDNGIEYSYRVISQSYDGALSVPSKVAIGQTRSAPNTVNGIRATNNKPHAIWVDWDPIEGKDIIGYNVWVADSENANYTKLAFVRSTSYIDKIQENGASRFYKVTAQDIYKLESEKQDVPTKGQTLSPPQTPTIIDSKIKNNSAVITWNIINDDRIRYYIVYRKGGNYDSINRFDRIMTADFIDTNMKKGVTYSYYVVSVDKFGIESLPSKTITLSIPMSPQQPDSDDIGKGIESDNPNNTNNPSSSIKGDSNTSFNTNKLDFMYDEFIYAYDDILIGMSRVTW